VTDAIAKIETVASTRNIGAFPHPTVRPLLIAWAALIGLLGLGYQWDAVQLWIGARALLDGGDPYTAVPAAGFPWPLYYPLPAVLLALPLATLPEPVARILWATATGAVFAYGVRGPARYAALSASFLVCLLLGQLAPVLMAAAAVPWLGFLWAAKPSLGLALFLAYPSRQAAFGCVLFLLISLALFPAWPGQWLATLGTQDHVAPVLQPGGFLLLLAWLRWRTPEGRLLGSLALIPHGGYDALVLYLVAKSNREALGLAGLGLVGAIVGGWLYPWHPGDAVTASPGRFLITLGAVYLPALVLVLRRVA
jgi:hypothetical protein